MFSVLLDTRIRHSSDHPTSGSGASLPGWLASWPSVGDHGGMPGLLTRYMAGELLKTILLTAAVLVAVIAFGTAIKPLSRNLLGGADILKYVMFAMVPMMEYALPFAAGFGATLVMHRLAGDNEIVAMNSCGLSPRRIFRPIFMLAAVLLLTAGVSMMVRRLLPSTQLPILRTGFIQSLSWRGH